MKAPLFWYRPNSLQSIALAPFGWVYQALTAVRLRRSPKVHAKIPLICVGNINAGGTGKTPTVIAIARHLIDLGWHPHIVSRGYGGSATGPLKVEPANHTAEDVGDEPLLLAAFAPTWVSKDRATAVHVAQNDGADIIIMDDGFQNPDVYKDLSIVVVDAVKGFGNGRALPAGPLRESPASGLARADALLVIGPKADRAAFTPDLPANCLRLDGQLDPLPTGMPLAGLPVLAFAGIGHPEKFFATLKSLGANVVRSEGLVDHQPLTTALMTRLDTEAKTRGLHLVTTEKDAVRLPPSFRQKVMTVPVRLTLSDWSGLNAKLETLGITSRSQLT